MQATPAKVELSCCLISSLIKGTITPSIIMFSNVPCAFTPLVIFMKKNSMFLITRALFQQGKSPLSISKGYYQPLVKPFVSESISRLGFMWNVGSLNWRQLISTIRKQWSFLAIEAIYICSWWLLRSKWLQMVPFIFFLHTIFCHYHSAGDVILLSMSYKVALPEALSDGLFCETMCCRSMTYWNENWKRKHLSLYIVLPWGPKI